MTPLWKSSFRVVFERETTHLSTENANLYLWGYFAIFSLLMGTHLCCEVFSRFLHSFLKLIFRSSFSLLTSYESQFFLLLECGADNEIRPGKDPIRCKVCGYRILYKKRTKQSMILSILRQEKSWCSTLNFF